MFNEKENSDFLREKLESEINLPESLSKENIINLVSGEKVNKNKRGIVRRFVAVGVAACLMITGVSFLWSRGFFSTPESISDENVVSEEVAQNTAESYDELISFIRAYAKEYRESKNNYFYTYEYSGTLGDVVINEEKAEDMLDGVPTAPAAAPSYNTNANTGTSGGEYGKVNLREHGVAEADIFITDGQYLYCIDKYGMRLRIVKAEPDGTLKSVYEGEEKRINSEGNGEDIHYSGLYIYENYLIVGFTRYNFEKYRSKTGCSGVQIYDISDKFAPKLQKEIALDGNYVSSRIIDSSLVLVTRYSVVDKFESTDDNDLLPVVYNGEMKYSVPCDCIVYSPEDTPETYVNIAKIDLSDLETNPAVSSYLGNVSDTYCTKDTLYVIGHKVDFNNTAASGARIMSGIMISAQNVCTTITKADISGNAADIKCCTEFNGSILNSYSIDEFGGYLRVAVTTMDNENCIYVFDENLGKVGELTGIAVGEQIKSARFMGNTAYVVTFVQTDPLFVIDLTNPEKPQIKGEVKLPGFSSYLHPVGNGLLVGIGVGGTETGTDGSSKISLFDVTDPTAPKEIDSLTFPTSNIDTDPKAFCGVTESSFLVPYSNWAVDAREEDSNYRYKHYTGALYVSATDNKLKLNNAYIARTEGDSVFRATFIGDNVYVFSGGESGVASFNMNTGEFIDAVKSDSIKFSFEPAQRPYSEILY